VFNNYFCKSAESALKANASRRNFKTNWLCGFSKLVHSVRKASGKQQQRLRSRHHTVLSSSFSLLCEIVGNLHAFVLKIRRGKASVCPLYIIFLVCAFVVGWEVFPLHHSLRDL